MDLISYARSMELADKHTDVIGKQCQPEEKVYSNRNYRELPRKKQSPACFNCGGNYRHKIQCPLTGKECRSCHKIGHFAKACKSKSSKKFQDKPRDKPPRTTRGREWRRDQHHKQVNNVEDKRNKAKIENRFNPSISLDDSDSSEDCFAMSSETKKKK